MKALFLLVILTKNGAGDINASFVNTQTLQQCQQKAAMLADVFKSSAIPVIESHCIKSGMQFSTFSHTVSSNMIRHFYRIEFKEESVSIKAVNNWRACMKNAQLDIDNERLYCASSVQKPD